MLVQDKGVISGSEEFHLEPSPMAEKLLYYVTDCGIYFCEYGYRVERENYGNYMLLYVTKGVLAVSTEGTTYLVQEGQVAFLTVMSTMPIMPKDTFLFCGFILAAQIRLIFTIVLPVV